MFGVPAVTEGDRVGDPVGGWAKQDLSILEERLRILIQHANPSLAEGEEGDHGQGNDHHGDRDRGKPTGRRLDEPGDPFTKQVCQPKEATNDDRRADEIRQQEPAVFDLEDPGSQIERAAKPHQKSGHEKRLDAVLAEQVLDRPLPLGREKARPPRVFLEDPGAKEPADGIHQAVAE